MRRSLLILSATAGIAVLASVVEVRRAVATRADAAYKAQVAHEIWVHQEDIKFFQWKIADDPHSAYHTSMLARTYLQHARETGDYEDYLRAETLLRQSLAMRTAHNATSYGLLASTLLAQHRFPEALVAAESLVAAEDWVPAHKAMVGEIAFEMGRYLLARAMFDSLRGNAQHIEIAPRLARWAELNGHVAPARVLLQNAFIDAKRMKHLPREQVSWFALRLGDLESRAGDLHAAERDYREGLGIFPQDYRLKAAMARLMLERSRYQDAARWGEDALGTVLEPGTLATLSDAYAAMGDRTKADEYRRVMEVAVLGQQGAIHRQWGLFLLDHGRDIELVAEKARLELGTRKDIYGWDVMAWALFKQGHVRDARVAMDSALRLGTRDPLLARHSAAIDSVLAVHQEAGR